MKTIQKELLEKCIPLEINKIFTHTGFINSASLSEGERELLHDLARDMQTENYVIILDEYCFYPFDNSYNGGAVLAGIKISKVEKAL